ncbi:UNVERIFIED_CONTAM: hypothetical protein FKN15_019005 [Acipenser sinensis]
MDYCTSFRPLIRAGFLQSNRGGERLLSRITNTEPVNCKAVPVKALPFQDVVKTGSRWEAGTSGATAMPSLTVVLLTTLHTQLKALQVYIPATICTSLLITCDFINNALADSHALPQGFKIVDGASHPRCQTKPTALHRHI